MTNLKASNENLFVHHNVTNLKASNENLFVHRNVTNLKQKTAKFALKKRKNVDQPLVVFLLHEHLQL